MGNIRVGKPDTRPEISAHMPGVREGNEPGGIENDPGLYPAGEYGAGRLGAKATARKSTGINPEKRDPIDPNSPTLPPA
jgi:hypothetical protein